MKKEGDNHKKERYFENKKYFLVFSVICLILFLFFFLLRFHNWANSTFINLHFCNHYLCILYSLIWLFFSLYYLFIFLGKISKKEDEDYSKGNKEDKDYIKDNKENRDYNKEEGNKKDYQKNKKIKKSILCLVLILILGVILMNIIGCYESGKIKMDFGFENLFFWDKNESLISCEKSTWPDCLGYCVSGSCVAAEKNGLGLCICESDEIYNGSTIATRNNSWITEPNKTIYGSCEDSAVDLDYPNWKSGVEIVNHCDEISYENCGGKPGRYFYDEETFCCFWDCKSPMPSPPSPVEPEKPIEETCQDSDSGLEPDIAGTCYDGDSYTDYCIDESNLMEFYCLNNSCVGVEWQCDFKCTKTDEGGICG